MACRFGLNSKFDVEFQQGLSAKVSVLLHSEHTRKSWGRSLYGTVLVCVVYFAFQCVFPSLFTKDLGFKDCVLIFSLGNALNYRTIILSIMLCFSFSLFIYINIILV